MKDVARGGIRIVNSRNREAYSSAFYRSESFRLGNCRLTTFSSVNQRNLFDEAYGLASTQALKNKDIPEGGSKGVILPDIGAAPLLVFEKYVDSSKFCFCHSFYFARFSPRCSLSLQ